MLAPPATDMDAKLVSNGRQAALQRADDAGRYAGGVPVHTHDGAERLEPEGMRQPSQELITAIMMHDSLADDCAQSCHSLCQFGAFEGKRYVASFGWRYDYTKHRLEAAAPLPLWLLPLIARIEAFTRSAPIRQVLCTEYDQGAGIGWHRDKPHFDEVFGLSLASQCRLRFRRQYGLQWQRFTLEALPRSLYMMSGAARQIWEHSIPPVAAPRVSITLRT